MCIHEGGGHQYQALLSQVRGALKEGSEFTIWRHWGEQFPQSGKVRGQTAGGFGLNQTQRIRDKVWLLHLRNFAGKGKRGW